MTIALLIITHGFPLTIAENIRNLGSDEVHSFVHVDRKSDRVGLEREVLKSLPASRHGQVHFLRQTLNTKWGAWSLVRATALLIREAQTRVDPDHFVLISGDTVGLVDRLGLQRSIETLGSQSAIEFGAWEKRDATDRYNSLHLMDLMTKSRDGKLDRVLNQIPKHVRRGYPDYPVYWGRHWCVLERSAAELVARHALSSNRYSRHFKRSLLPEEAFIQTLLVNELGAEKLSNVRTMYADYSRAHPGELDMTTLEPLFGKYLFARKAPQDPLFLGAAGRQAKHTGRIELVSDDS